jgi:hypothetical protein
MLFRFHLRLQTIISQFCNFSTFAYPLCYFFIENETSAYQSSIMKVSPGEMIFTFTSGANRAAKLANDLGGSARILGISHLNP